MPLRIHARERAIRRKEIRSHLQRTRFFRHSLVIFFVTAVHATRFLNAFNTQKRVKILAKRMFLRGARCDFARRK
ncbi:MAG: hypothetical protein AB7M12_00665 [Hyphomonadaceae bacterium]